MKYKILFTTFFFFLVFNVNSQKIRTTVTYFPYPDSEQIHSENEYYKKGKIGIPHGYYKEYFKNGNLRINAKYSNGFPIGEYREYFESGNILKLGNYNSENNGTLKDFFKNGSLMKSSLFIDGKEKVVKRGFQNGNYAVYSENNVLDYYDKLDVLIKSIENNRKNSVKVNGDKIYYIHYPEILIDEDKEGLVICQISVDKYGGISEVMILESFNQKASDVIISHVKSIRPEDIMTGEKQEIIFSIDFVID
jgi:hypothetical protein